MKTGKFWLNSSQRRDIICHVVGVQIELLFRLGSRYQIILQKPVSYLIMMKIHKLWLNISLHGVIICYTVGVQIELLCRLGVS